MYLRSRIDGHGSDVCSAVLVLRTLAFSTSSCAGPHILLLWQAPHVVLPCQSPKIFRVAMAANAAAFS